MKELLLKLGDHGEPSTFNKGILLLNSFPFDTSGDYKDVIFKIKLVISAASPVTRDGIIWTNIPTDPSVMFNREKFYKNPIDNSFYKDINLTLSINKPGVYAYFASYRSAETNKIITTRKYYFVVQPSLDINGEYLTLNSVSIQSVVSKWMGPLKDWDNIFQEISNKGYNMVHFTPLQHRGESNSPYSIFDQLSFDPNLFESTKQVENLVKKMHSEFKLLSMTDIVWNHTANNSDWLRDHPEAGYSKITAPHLTAAIELDKALLVFSTQLEKLGYTYNINTVDDLLNIMDGIKTNVLEQLKLWEFYTLNVEKTISQLKEFLVSHPCESIPIIQLTQSQIESLSELAKLATDFCTDGMGFGLSSRHGNELNVSKFASVVLSYIKEKPQVSEASFENVLSESDRLLNEINLPLYRIYDTDVSVILEQLFNRIKYLRIDDHGPKLGKISIESPLTEPYFTRFDDPKTGEEIALANNGWVWNGNPLIDFASDKSKAYLRREVIVWGDCVKLRYGSDPKDSPYLWDRMIKYTQLCAKVFDGFRIDNCHSTPIHVGERLIDAAREVNPNLYVVAELFSGSEDLDSLFVERLGISSLIREAMQAWSEDELSRLLRRHAGRPIGSLKWLPLDDFAYPASCEPEANKGEYERVSEIAIPKFLAYQEPHALFMDCTHDNETPFQKRTVEDTLPNAALVGLCSCAVGSVFGYDECYPKLLDVVKETRSYTFGDNGIGHVKKKIYALRNELAKSNLSLQAHEMHIHHEDQYITFHRTNAKTGNGVFLIARTKFADEGAEFSLKPITFHGSKITHEFAYTLKKVGDPKASDAYIPSIPVEVQELESPQFEYNPETNETTVTLPKYFPRGSIAVFRTQYLDFNEELDKYLQEGAIEASKDLNLYDLNALLYKCESEERDASAGRDGNYNIPKYGHLVYSGLQGWISAIKDAINENDLSHPFCKNVREGVWSLDYIVNRTLKYTDSPGIQRFHDWMASRINTVKGLPFFLRPKYFVLVLGIAYEACRFRSLSLLSPMFHEATLFVQDLGLTSIQMIGINRSASLNPFKPVPSMAAGLPHFSYDWARCWGRDIFISLRGLLLASGRYDDAKNHILAAGSTLKHGLIPNLIDSLRNPRYNARDATWFWLQSIQDYITVVPDGEKILDENVKRRFPLNDKYVSHDDPEAFSYESSIRELIYEVFARHAKGQDFREANAGPMLDRQMKDEGFNIKINVDWETGLIFGGSQLNCGTWMDKMGESEKAGSKGIPGTPRDGAAIEISGLLKSSLRFVNQLNKQGLFDYTEVEKEDGTKISFEKWEQLVGENFERVYYIPMDDADNHKFDVNPAIINRRGIYKDLYRSGKEYEDYQLRPNFAIAMVVAPELFTPKYAVGALRIADTTIRGPVGMRTLDPSDYNYRPYYINSEDSTDFLTSKGRNYHQGPEWVWCIGYFLRAYSYFYSQDSIVKAREHNNTKKIREQLYRDLMYKLEGNKKWVKSYAWRGLTELTNKDGELCQDSSPTQAWSSGCIIDLFYDFYDTDKNNL
ncbi:bifunctional 4-alpha-glucanotransferase/amylo-alpha-1,6-glucosidase [Saccharomycopsis crataegensis]|uniref:Glycogen debranching enzyme n=1 Tax=Saccharomycopsis crataegensis TaxID=43959 RepID=A0AAV5QXX4_9ASCO|nr:bifunctional 4-alpha-glucanotransferase/amylo-alpha-1,6-glucosidase [Saccharomycopsis crataegensis]